MIVGISGKKQSGKNTVALIWQYLYDYYYNNYKHPMTVEDFKEYVKNNHHLKSVWIQKSFAYKLKQIFCILTGCNIEQLEEENFKNSKLPKEWTVWKFVTTGEVGYLNDNTYLDAEHIRLFNTKEELDNYVKNFNTYDIDCHYYEYLPTYREALQFIGTDLFRNMFHPNTHVISFFNDYTPLDDALEVDLTSHEGVKTVYEYPKWLVTDVRFPNEAKAIKDREGILVRVNSRKEFLPNPSLSHEDIHYSEVALDDYSNWDYIIDNNGSLEQLIDKVKTILIKENII